MKEQVKRVKFKRKRKIIIIDRGKRDLSERNKEKRSQTERERRKRVLVSE